LVRQVVGEGLSEAGFDVVVAGLGSEALELFERGEAPDALVCDLSMPGMDGLAVIREARRLRPKLPAILMTGYVSSATQLSTDEDLSLMRKPVDSRALAESIGALVGRTAALG
jgi:CheY-like chemotaxis protein